MRSPNRFVRLIAVAALAAVVLVSASATSMADAMNNEAFMPATADQQPEDVAGRQSEASHLPAPLSDLTIEAVTAIGSGMMHGVAEESGFGRGWLARWLALGGEGEVIVQLLSGNMTYPHRPAAFPQHLHKDLHLPAIGFLLPFTSFPAPLNRSEPTHRPGSPGTPMQACLPPAWPPIRWTPPALHPQINGSEPDDCAERKLIALIERGGCDFATKVLAAQERGARAVIVGDSAARAGESRAEGGSRTGGLITMFSPEDTDNIHLPSVFVSRAAFLDLMDLLANSTEGVQVEISPGGDDAGTLGSMLSFALLMPSCFLLATIAIHRIRVARQQELNRAPPQVVLNLPERIWQPDIVWEKDEDESTPEPPNRSSPGSRSLLTTPRDSRRPSPQRTRPRSGTAGSSLHHLETISARDVATPQPIEIPDPLDQAGASLPPAAFAASGPSTSIRPVQARTRSAQSLAAAAAAAATAAGGGKKRYFSKDECAICMDEFQPGDIVRILPCGHVFHKEECDEWLLKWRKLCPTCRADVTLPPVRLEGVQLTPVAGVHADEAEPGVHNGDGIQPLSTVGSRVSGWISRTRRTLFGRTDDARSAPDANERTLLVDRADGRV